MKIILTNDVESLGRKGDVKDVKNGYARNYLLPHKFAIEATSSNLKVWEQRHKAMLKVEAKFADEARELASQMESLVIPITMKAGEEGKLFGSVTSQLIANGLTEKGYNISRKDIGLESPIKVLGTHDVTIKLHHEVSVTVQVDVTAENPEPETPAEDQPDESPDESSE